MVKPPFQHVKKVLDKIQEDETHALVVMPRWEVRSWYKLASKMALGEVFSHNILNYFH